MGPERELCSFREFQNASLADLRCSVKIGRSCFIFRAVGGTTQGSLTFVLTTAAARLSKTLFLRRPTCSAIDFRFGPFFWLWPAFRNCPRARSLRRRPPTLARQALPTLATLRSSTARDAKTVCRLNGSWIC